MQIKLILILAFILPGLAFADCSESKFTETQTVWVDATFGFRKKSGAKGINKIHKQMEAKGWCFKDFELYTENGDLEGFFLTYTRAKSNLKPAQPDDS